MYLRPLTLVHSTNTIARREVATEKGAEPKEVRREPARTLDVTRIVRADPHLVARDHKQGSPTLLADRVDAVEERRELLGHQVARDEAHRLIPSRARLQRGSTDMSDSVSARPCQGVEEGSRRDPHSPKVSRRQPLDGGDERRAEGVVRVPRRSARPRRAHRAHDLLEGSRASLIRETERVERFTEHSASRSRRCLNHDARSAARSCCWKSSSHARHHKGSCVSILARNAC